MLEGLAGARLRKDEADRAVKRVQEVTGWSDPVEEKTGFVGSKQTYKTKTSFYSRIGRRKKKCLHKVEMSNCKPIATPMIIP